MRTGFGQDLSVGDTLLPSIIGPVTRRNAEGYNIIHRDQKKETHWRTVEWTWKQYRGRNDYEKVTEFKDVPYERYPRTFVPPYGFELSIAINSSGEKYVVSSGVNIDLSNAYNEIKHIVNLFLELFGECHILCEKLNTIIQPKLVRLNWEILPAGEYPWAERVEQIRPFIEKAKPKNQSIVKMRLEIINKYKPDFVAIGRCGFCGYIVYGFDSKRLYVFESVQVNNATYIFNKDWKDITVLTKKEILDSKMQIDRVIHLVNSWEGKIEQYLK
jgi:hypothetical protein